MKEIFECNCYSEGLMLDFDKEYKEVYLSIWSAGYDNRYDFKGKLRQVWNILKTGTPYKDQIALDLKEARLFKDKLDSAIKEIE